MKKRAILSKVVQDIRASYWALPTLLVGLAVVAAQVSLYIDLHSNDMIFYLPESWQATQVDGARATLSAISQSVIGVAGVMFSVTIVAVTFASGNYGPRLISNFMRDRGTQWSLGILIATFAYALLILRAVQSGNGASGETSIEAFVPHLSMLLSLGLAGVSVLTMIFYVHHIPETINVSNLSASLGDRLRLALRQRIDAQDGEAQQDVPPELPDRAADASVHPIHSGYLQTWDKNRLTELAETHDLIVEVRFETGGFVGEYTPLLCVWASDGVDDELVENLRDCFAIGKTPTETQNMLFLAQQLVEMIGRALSPGINDPYTAINCINWIYIGLSTAANYNGGLRAVHSKRLRTSPVCFEDLFDGTVVKALYYVKTDPLALQHLREMLERLAAEMADTRLRERVVTFRRTLD